MKCGVLGGGKTNVKAGAIDGLGNVLFGWFSRSELTTS